MSLKIHFQNTDDAATYFVSQNHLTRAQQAYIVAFLSKHGMTNREIRSTLEAKAAMDKEWKRLRDKNVWDERGVREWDDVRAEAKRKGQEVHIGYIFGIFV